MKNILNFNFLLKTFVVALCFLPMFLAFGCDAKKDISTCDFSLEYIETVFNGQEKKPSVIVSENNKTLKLDEDYMIQYAKNLNSGMAQVKISGLGNYEGKKILEFKIKKKQILAENVFLEISSYFYNGQEIKPTPLVVVDNQNLILGNDFEVVYENNLNAGTGIITVSGIRNFEGVATKEFAIKRLSFADVNVALNSSVYTYTGYPIQLDLDITYGAFKLLEEVDYTIVFKDNKRNVGAVEFTIQGIGNYQGEIERTVVIEKFNISNLFWTLENQTGQFEYTGMEIKPQILEDCFNLNGYILTEEDYEITYFNNVEKNFLGDESPYLTITGKGNFTGNFTIYFDII